MGVLVSELETLLKTKTKNAELYRNLSKKDTVLNEEDEIELFSTAVNDSIRVIMPLKNILKKLEEGCNYLGIGDESYPCLRFSKKGV